MAQPARRSGARPARGIASRAIARHRPRRTARAVEGHAHPLAFRPCMAVVEGQRRFAAPPERVFALLTDPDVVASAMPAMRGHTVIDADRWEAKVKPPLPLAPSIRIRFEVQERRPPEH